MNDYIFRNGKNQDDLNQLKALYNKVFAPEKVGELADALTLHYPDFNFENWFIAEHNQEIVSGLALIPWRWQFEDVTLKVGEMAIVATDEKHRGQGLLRKCNEMLSQELVGQSYDLSIIQGIPGFYHQFGYHYAVNFEHHTELALYSIPDLDDSNAFRAAEFSDIPFLMQEDERYRKEYSLSIIRSEAKWKYILSEGKNSGYETDVFIIKQFDEQYYCRILKQGFGEGLIVSEASYNMPKAVLDMFLSFLKQQANEAKKPYIRLNMPDSHCLVKYAKHFGAINKPGYAWQIKIVDKCKFINKLTPLFEARIANSEFAGLNGTIVLDLYKTQITFEFKGGLMQSPSEKTMENPDYLMSIPEDLLAALILGHRSWQELQYNRPDIFPADQYLRFNVVNPAEVTGRLMNVLFPKTDNWAYCQY